MLGKIERRDKRKPSLPLDLKCFLSYTSSYLLVDQLYSVAYRCNVIVTLQLGQTILLPFIKSLVINGIADPQSRQGMLEVVFFLILINFLNMSILA